MTMSAAFAEEDAPEADDLVDKLSAAPFGQFEFPYRRQALMLGFEIAHPTEEKPATSS